MKKKKKANEMPPTSIEESLPHTLRLHGEAFMSMFEDIGDEGRREVGTGTDQDRETGPAPAAAKDADAADAADAAKETAGKKSRKKNKKRRALDTPAMANPTSHPRVARNVDEMDAIFGSIKNGDTGDEDKGNEDGEADDSRQGRKSSAKKKHKGKPNKSTSSASIPDAGERERERERQQLEEELRRKIERKRFMASDTDSMLSFDEEAMLAEAKKRIDRSQTAGRGGGFDKRKDMEEFKAIRREIQSFGATGLDKKSRAKFEQDRLLELGARKQKGVRMSAKIGSGIAKKAAWREQRSIDEAIASGMVSRKAIAEKKRREIKKERGGQDRGLFEDGGRFNPRNGVMRVSK